MSQAVIFALPGNSQLAHALVHILNFELGIAEIRDFPDGESLICIKTDVKNKIAILICSLDHPNPKIIPLMFMAQTLKELGAKKIILVAPYLAYMRQDKRFHSGEAISSVLFAKFLSSWIDDLITIDPHLHRIHHLSEIYSISNIVTLHATKNIANWISHNVDSPLLIGPDEESRQWVSEISEYANLPCVIGQKNRLGDREVITTIAKNKNTANTPVLVDDIISSGASMVAAINLLLTQGFKKPICIGVHALFDTKAEQNLMRSGASLVVTCNTILHSTNKIDLTEVIAKGLSKLLGFR
ncbi:MAG: ribose-phosphate diphosphokinase [Legionellaceae bacterium]|nr:ribose-phosphate diphosphokinase [Legionellaceae bacterium]